MNVSEIKDLKDLNNKIKHFDLLQLVSLRDDLGYNLSFYKVKTDEIKSYIKFLNEVIKAKKDN